MDSSDNDLWENITIDPVHLTTQEIEHECTIRAVYYAGLAPAAYQAQLAYSFDQERTNNQDIVETYKETGEQTDLQAKFDALLQHIGVQSGQFFSAIAAPDFSPASLLSRLQHYNFRLKRFPTEQYDSAASATTRKLFNDLARIAIKVAQPSTDRPADREFTDATTPDSQLNSTTIARESHADDAGQQNESNATAHTHSDGATVAHNADEVQTSESFRLSSSFQALANHPTPLARRGIPLGVHFQTPEHNPLPAHIRTPQMDWSFHSHGIPHSTRTATTTVSSTNTQPTIMQPTSTSSGTMTNTVALMPHEFNGSQNSGLSNTNNRSGLDTFSRQAGSELQALKRWLGAKTFEGELVDGKHFSVDEFLSNLKLCVQSGMCTEQTMMRNLAPAFTGRAFKWWTTTHDRIQTFNQLAQSLKQRFATFAGSQEGLMAAIYGRRQQKNEALPDFVDTMQQLMDQLPGYFNDKTRVATIVSCALPEEAKLLMSRQYADIGDFTRHVAFLSQHRPKPTLDRFEKRPNREKSVFVCEVA